MQTKKLLNAIRRRLKKDPAIAEVTQGRIHLVPKTKAAIVMDDGTEISIKIKPVEYVARPRSGGK